jgi:CHAD domain-containing protein
MAFSGSLANTMPASIPRYELLHKRLDRFTRMLQGLDEGDIDALHQARVASRRLRELLPVLQVDSAVARRLGRKLRKVTQRLGAVRELDVMYLLIDELQRSGRHDPQALRRVASAIAEERAQARDKLLTKLPTEDLHRIAGKLNKVVSDLKSGKASRGWRWAVEARVTHRASVLKDALVDAGALYLPERLHAVRIAVKKLRYAREVSAEASGTKSNQELQSLKRGQDILGRLHDMQMLLDRVRQLQVSLTPPDVTMWRKLDKLTTALEDECRRLHARFMRQRNLVLTLCDRTAMPKSSSTAARRAAS